ncbi:BTB/POZ domain [Dillenia turbinata]|uniref:BTB/POZ domain n=1 Tax=Dillenia turbinata TaxID=194707 RepID=A0AAN8WEH0_9MAGN
MSLHVKICLSDEKFTWEPMRFLDRMKGVDAKFALVVLMGDKGELITIQQNIFLGALTLLMHGCCDCRERKWQCTDIEIQKLVVRSISAFADSLSKEMFQHPLVKDSLGDILWALEGILRLKNEAVLSMAAKVTAKLVSILPSIMLRSHVLDLVYPLSSLLSFDRLEVSVSCAIALNLILKNLAVKQSNEVWPFLEETDAVVHVVRNIKEFSGGTRSVEYIKEMVSLLSTILWWWPLSRYPVWSDAKLMSILEALLAMPDISVRLAVLLLYSAIALCGIGAKKILENGNSIQLMIDCMGSLQPYSVRIEAFKLAQHLVISEQGCLEMMRLCCEPFVTAIISGMSGWSLQSEKIANDQLSLLMEACRLAQITRWPGEHHKFFWKLRIEIVLVSLLVKNSCTAQQRHHLSLTEQLVIARKGLQTNFLPALRPFIWDILGWMATHCGEDFNPTSYGNAVCIKLLLTCACLVFADSILKGRQIHQNCVNSLRSEPASRAVLLLINSRCTYIASESKTILCEVLRPKGVEYVQCILDSLKSMIFEDKLRMHDNLQAVIDLIGLICCSSLSGYSNFISEGKGIKMVLTLIRWCLNNHLEFKRQSIAPHLHYYSGTRTCCCVISEDWEGKNLLLFLGLWGLVEILHQSPGNGYSEILGGQLECSKAQLIGELEQICCSSCPPGPKMFSACILSYFGVHGFPSKLGKRIGKALCSEEFSDIQFILRNGELLNTHGVILVVRCQSLLPNTEFPIDQEKTDGSARKDNQMCKKNRKEVRLSTHVDPAALLKLLEYIYLGYSKVAEKDLLKQLRTLARHCNLQPLLQLHYGRSPKWGAPFPSYDLSAALGPAGHHFSDVILEAKEMEAMLWTCSVCSLLSPHIHVHKVILCSSCDYLHALFQSGMQESHSPTIKVPICWGALVKLVHWFYSDELPYPVSGCLWENMDPDERLRELKPYAELCWLAEFWFLEEVQEECVRIITSRLDSTGHLAVKIVQIAADLSQWKLVEVAANHLAPLYRSLRESGDLETLDLELVEIIRAASVRFFQGKCS